LVPNTKSYKALGLAVLPNEIPEPVKQWLAAEKSVVAMPWL
jgi:hypothetical protein